MTGKDLALLSHLPCPHCHISMPVTASVPDPFQGTVEMLLVHPDDGEINLGPRAIACGYRNKNILAKWQKWPQRLLSMDSVERIGPTR